MDHIKIPIGFGPELMQNGIAMSKFADWNTEEPQDIPEQAHELSAREEMRRLIYDTEF